MTENATIYKISYVITGGKHPGAIVNSHHRPAIGELVNLGNQVFEIVEVLDLMPSRGNFHYLHVTCKYPDEQK